MVFTQDLGDTYSCPCSFPFSNKYLLSIKTDSRSQMVSGFPYAVKASG